MDSRSMFSVNTFQTSMNPLQTQSTNKTQNQLHQYLYKLLPTFSIEYPYLSRIFFLQLVLRENFIIFTEDRVDVRDIWLSIAKKLRLPKPDLYVVDQHIKMEDILNTKSEYQRVMLYDVDRISIDNVNKILNSGLQASSVSFMAIQNPKVTIQPYISDLFSMSFYYHASQPLTELMETFSMSRNVLSGEEFSKAEFNEAVKSNFQISVQQTEEEGFLKPFIMIFEETLKEQGVEISQSRWKKMFKTLKFIGVNKHAGTYKRISLADFSMVSQLLSSSMEQYERINRCMLDSMRAFIPYFGIIKMEKSIKSHFFACPSNIKAILQICSQLKSSVSFFYPCTKFPDTAFILVQPLKAQEEKSKGIKISYQINGYEKKIKSDHHYEVQQGKRYRLRMKVEANCKMIVHLGIACYDSDKNFIETVQACRRKGSEVIFDHIEGEYLHVSNPENLTNWSGVASEADSFAYERAIGIYPDGNTSQLAPLTNIVFNRQEPYSKDQLPYLEIEQNRIRVSKDTRQWFANFKHLVKKNKTVLMNHFEDKGGFIGQSLQMEKGQEKEVEIIYNGFEFENNGNNFYCGAKYVRIVGMINYNSGYPEYLIENKNGSFLLREATWQVFEDQKEEK